MTVDMDGIFCNCPGMFIKEVSTYTYDAPGELDTDPLAVETNYLYTGQQFDVNTELYSLRARYYDPGIGRFLTRDTWAYDYNNPFELNRYVYVANNPVRYIDPSGFQAKEGYASLLGFLGGVSAPSLTEVGLVMTFSISILLVLLIDWQDLLDDLLNIKNGNTNESTTGSTTGTGHTTIPSDGTNSSSPDPYNNQNNWCNNSDTYGWRAFISDVVGGGLGGILGFSAGQTLYNYATGRPGWKNVNPRTLLENGILGLFLGSFNSVTGGIFTDFGSSITAQITGYFFNGAATVGTYNVVASDYPNNDPHVLDPSLWYIGGGLGNLSALCGGPQGVALTTFFNALYTATDSSLQ